MAYKKNGRKKRGGKITHFRDKAEDMVEKTKHKAHEVKVRTERSIRQHPARSMAIAAGVGAAIGAIAGAAAASRRNHMARSR